MSGQVENCSNCAFAGFDYHGMQVCRKRAPQVAWGDVGPQWMDGKMVPMMGPITIWPRVNSFDFCGEFELKDAQ